MRYLGMMHDGGGEAADAPSQDVIDAQAQAAIEYGTQWAIDNAEMLARQAAVRDANQAGVEGDYSSLNKIIKDPELYSAFKKGRLDRIAGERILNTPEPTPTPTPTPTPAPTPTPTPTPAPTPTPTTTTNTNINTNPTVNSTPNNPPPNVPANPPPAIKTATPQYVTFNDDEVPIDVIVDLLFENVGGQELLSISRHDTVLGQKILYQPFKNLNIIKEEYNPNNLVRLQQTSDKFFANYTIKLSDKTPVIGNGANGDNVYLDTDGNLVIEFINLNNDEQAEVQITTNGTIYEAGI
jgi:hypothetical protein